jgi:hypothetical protein
MPLVRIAATPLEEYLTKYMINLGIFPKRLSGFRKRL